MISLALLAGCVVAGAAAFAVGWPAYRSDRARRARLVNEQRYLAWRGRARQPAGSPIDAYQATRDRSRLIAAAALAGVALICLIGFFVVTG